MYDVNNMHTCMYVHMKVYLYVYAVVEVEIYEVDMHDKTNPQLNLESITQNSIFCYLADIRQMSFGHGTIFPSLTTVLYFTLSLVENCCRRWISEMPVLPSNTNFPFPLQHWLKSYKTGK